jgi:hypothetical protein
MSLYYSRRHRLVYTPPSRRYVPRIWPLVAFRFVTLRFVPSVILVREHNGVIEKVIGRPLP